MTSVLDLFCGAGGFSYGFAKRGFDVTGVDKLDEAGETFLKNKLGKFENLDLSKEKVRGNYDIIIGGPPCRPWSSVNLTRRKKNHQDYNLVSRYFWHVENNLPKIFLFENVPQVKNDNTLNLHMKKLSSKKFGYSIAKRIINYNDYGASTKRKRLIMCGVRDGVEINPLDSLGKETYGQNITVEDAIGYLRNVEFGGRPDHDWPNLKTINRYMKYYKTGKFGWYILKWNEPAPSFGNIMKTYILHPDSRVRKNKRVISVKETLMIMGYPKGFNFVKGIGIATRYQMAVDSVSPMFSNIVAKTIKYTL